MNLNKHIWEGWTVQNFIDELSITFEYAFNDAGTFPWETQYTRDDVKRWCMDNQPYYKKYIPEVVDYFWNKIK